MKRTLILGALSLALIFVTNTGNAADLTDAKQIIQNANEANYYAGKDGRAKVRMSIFDDQGRKRIRQFSILRRNHSVGGDQDYLVYFSRPADVRKTVFLVNKHVKSDDDRWMYLPALDLVKRIAAGDKRTSFVGSHFFYEDISGRGVDEDNHALVKTTDTHYVIKGTPKDKGSVEFAHYTVLIDKQTFLPSKIDYVDGSGKTYRRIEALNVEEINGKPTVTKMKATDLVTKGYTINEMKGIQYDISVPKAVFTERSLRNPPREWFKKKS
jgi:hypothetical protein